MKSIFGNSKELTIKEIVKMEKKEIKSLAIAKQVEVLENKGYEITTQELEDYYSLKYLKSYKSF